MASNKSTGTPGRATMLTTSVFPNPHTGNFSLQVSSPAQGQAMIELFNVNSRLVGKKTVAVVPGNNNVVFTGVKHTLLFYKVAVGKSTSKGKIIGIQ